MSSLLHDLGVWCFRRAKTVVALWLVLLVMRIFMGTFRNVDLVAVKSRCGSPASMAGTGCVW